MEQENSCCHNFDKKYAIIILGMVLLAAIVMVSILRDWITNDMRNQVSVTGQGKISYQPDEANVTLGIQVDKAPTAEEALRRLNEKMTQVVAAVKEAGIPEEDIMTQSYNLNPNYDYDEGRNFVSGYDARQNLAVKIKNIDESKELAGQVVAAANKAGVNNIGSITFDVSDMNSLKQQARIKAIGDAKAKAEELFKAAGVKPKKIVGWYENEGGYGGNQPMEADMLSSAKEGRGMGGVAPELPSGSQEIVVEVGVNYEVK